MKFNWNEFHPEQYLDHNYAQARPDDLALVSSTADFLISRLNGRSDLRGVDVGSGPNLYPTLAMLPFCREITLIEYSESGRRWLEQEIPRYSPLWSPFWRELKPKARYREVADPARAVAARVKVQPGSVFDLPRNAWDLGTMFFVAEAITSDEKEFRRGLRCFVDCLTPGAPFVAAFMENSQGYSVNGHFFPTVPVAEKEVRDCLKGIVEGEIEFIREGLGDNPLRKGYTGMILACGVKTSEERHHRDPAEHR